MHKKFLSVLLLGTTMLLSCHKSGQQPASNCTISAVSVKGNGVSGTYLISYNNDGKPSEVKYSDDGTAWARSFTYSAGLIVTNTTGSNTATDSIYLNANGDIDHIVDHQPPSFISTTTMTYNSGHQLTEVDVQSGGGIPVISTYQYSNGDLTKVDEDGADIVYTYYTDKAASTAGLMEFAQWVKYGVIYQRSAHLVKAYGYNNPDEEVSYTYDGSGKISAMTVGNGSAMMTFNYSYDCH